MCTCNVSVEANQDLSRWSCGLTTWQHGHGPMVTGLTQSRPCLCLFTNRSLSRPVHVLLRLPAPLSTGQKKLLLRSSPLEDHITALFTHELWNMLRTTWLRLQVWKQRQWCFVKVLYFHTWTQFNLQLSFILSSGCITAVCQRSAVLLWLQLWGQTPLIWENWIWGSTSCRTQEWRSCVVFYRVQPVDWRLWGQFTDWLL